MIVCVRAEDREEGRRGVSKGVTHHPKKDRGASRSGPKGRNSVETKVNTTELSCWASLCVWAFFFCSSLTSAFCPPLGRNFRPSAAARLSQRACACVCVRIFLYVCVVVQRETGEEWAAIYSKRGRRGG